ncbi:MAG TPA: PIN domain-containing protein [Bryobacteraceae bacterium]|nr:PIN domain-containing protein [Bryobacteraceae bacterium]
MLLADTSIWIDHFRRGDREFGEELSRGEVLMHPFILGEISCGNLKDRTKVLFGLSWLTRAPRATDEDVAELVEQRRLWGKGLGWIDAHLLASAILSDCRFRTLDQRLDRAARELGIPA